MDSFWNRRRKRRWKMKHERIIRDRIIRAVKTLLEQQEEDYYEPKRVSNFWNNNYIEYESNGDKNRSWSLGKCLNKTEHYLRNIRPRVVDLLFIVDCMHQKINALFCCINFDYMTKSVKKCFIFLSIFFLLSIKKEKKNTH